MSSLKTTGVGPSRSRQFNLYSLSTMKMFCIFMIINIVVGGLPVSGRGTGVSDTSSLSSQSPIAQKLTIRPQFSESQEKNQSRLSRSSDAYGAAGQALRGEEMQESKSLIVDKSPPQLQLGLSSTVPFASISADRLIPSLSGHHGHKKKIQNQEKSFGVDPYHHHHQDGGNDETWDLGLGHLLKFKFGGLLIAAVVSVAALVLFIPTVFGARFPPHGGVLMPSFIHQLMPGLGLGGLGDDYNSYYAPGGGGSFGSYSSTSYNNLYKSEEGNGAGHGRSLTRPVRGNNGTILQPPNPIISSMSRTAQNYWKQVETCAAHSICLRGKEVMAREKAVGSKNDGGNEKNLDKENGLTSFEHILETMNGMKGMTRNMPMFHQLYKAFKAGQSESIDCATVYKQCPATTANQISKTLKNMGKYIFT